MKYILILLLLTAGVSYFYHEGLYIFFYKTYYSRIKKESLDASIQKSEKLYKEKKYKALKEYIKPLIEIYPDDKHLKKIAARTLIKTALMDKKEHEAGKHEEDIAEPGDAEKGARLLMECIDPLKDRELFSLAMDVFFKGGWYSDVVRLLQNYPIGREFELHRIYGISLFKVNRYTDALQHLKEAEKMLKGNYDIYYYTGIIHERNKNMPEAVLNLEKSLELKNCDNEVRQSLIRAYTAMKKFDKAEKITRQGQTTSMSSPCGEKATAR
jgi:tetratricopeptide (TPR) repeat protein